MLHQDVFLFAKKKTTQKKIGNVIVEYPRPVSHMHVQCTLIECAPTH